MPVINVSDQLGNQLQLTHPAKRIVSLVPSITELLAYFHLDDETVGITKFCILPHSWFTSKTRIGGTKQIDIAKIRSLRPDLIIANKEENVKEQVDELGKDVPVYISDVHHLDSALQMMKDVATLTGREQEGTELTKAIAGSFATIARPRHPIKVCYLIWQKPYMTVGGDTFINAMLQQAGFKNVFEQKYRYPEVSPENILASGCHHILLSSEPFPFQQKHADDLQFALSNIAMANQKPPAIWLVDGQMCSWYGPRMLEAAAYLENLQKKLPGVEDL